MPSCACARATASTASPSDAPGARLKLSVTDGNCAWCVIASGAVLRSIVAIADKGTCGVRAFCAVLVRLDAVLEGVAFPALEEVIAPGPFPVFVEFDELSDDADPET